MQKVSSPNRQSPKRFTLVKSIDLPTFFTKHTNSKVLTNNSLSHQGGGSKNTTYIKTTHEDDLVSHNNLAYLQTTIQSPHSAHKTSIYLPQLSARKSSEPNNHIEFILPKKMHHHSPSSILPSILSNVAKYSKLNIDTDENFTSVEFLNRLKRLFPRLPNNKVLIPQGFTRKQYSIKDARRIMKLLEDELTSIRTPRQNTKTLMTSASSLEFQKQYSEQYTIVESLDSAVTDLYEVCERALINIRSKKELEVNLKEMTDISSKSQNSELVLYTFLIQAKASLARNEVREAISLFKQHKSLCDAHRLFHNKIFSYKNLGKCYQELGKNRISLIYYTKFLQMAWAIGSVKDELHAYDCIGKQYYYCGLINRAAYFHNRMTLGKVEPKGSSLKQIGISKIKSGKDTYKDNYLLNIQSSDAGNQEGGQAVVEEEDREVSSREEAIDLDTIVPDEVNDHVEEVVKSSEFGNDLKTKKKIKKSRMEKYMNGLMRCQMISNRKKKEMQGGAFSRKKTVEQVQYVKTERDEEEESIDPNSKMKQLSLLTSKPNEQILLAHLSRNRNLKNFSVLGTRDMDWDVEDDQLTLSTAVTEKIRKLLIKFKMNLRMIKESLEVCGD